MAKSKGMIDVGEVTLDCESDHATTLYMYFIHRVPWGHSYWHTADDNNGLLRHKIDRQVTITDDNEPEIAQLDINWYCAERGTESFSTTDEPDITASWEGPDTDTKYPTGIIFEKSPGDETDKLRYQICEMEIEITSGGAGNIDIEIQSVWTELIHDDTTPGFDVEFLKRSAATRLYGPDYFISAWHVMNVLCEAHLRMQYEGRCRYTLPLCGSGVEPYA